MRGFPLISLLPLLFIVLSAAGIVLITLGVRGRPVFASPRCRKCGYDLRNMQFLSAEIGNCPECGVSLATPDAVTFGRWRRQPHRVVWGAVLMVLPWFLALGLVFAFRRGSAAMVTGPAAVTSQSTPALLASLPKAAGSPWEWQELERRLKANQLTTADVDAAFAALATSLNADRAAGKDRQPLHWSGSFITAAIAANSASQAKVDALCQAYYDMAPPIQMRTRAREGVPIAFIVNVHEPWNIDTLQRCWALTSITVDGATKLTPQEQYSHHDPVQLDALSGTGRDGERHLELANTLSPGEHELAFAYECGVVSENATFRGIEGRPG